MDRVLQILLIPAAIYLAFLIPAAIYLAFFMGHKVDGD
jgi:hypothetical protein